jgi:hypothetical protein
MSKQVKTNIEIEYKKRDRKTVFWRGILAFPPLVFLTAFTQAAHWGYTTGLIVLPTFFALVVRGVYPSYVLDFNHALVELQTRVFAYLFLLTDDFPSIEKNKNVEVSFPEIKGGKSLNRWLPLVKWFLAIPLVIVGMVYLIIAAAMSVFAWIITWTTGKYPKWAGKFVYGTIKYWNRVSGYAMILVTDKYPSFKL